MSAYKLLKQGVKRLADGACIPPSPDNVDWQAFLAWQAAGNTPDPQDPEPVTEPQITLDDVIAVLAPEQKSALEARVSKQ